MPHIDIGGVEKNFFLISNFLAKNRNNIVVITMSKRSKKFFCKNIKFVTFKSNFLEKISKRSKYVLSLLLLIKEVLINKNSIVVSFQANIYCGLLSKLLAFLKQKILKPKNIASNITFDSPSEKLVNNKESAFE